MSRIILNEFQRYLGWVNIRINLGRRVSKVIWENGVSGSLRVCVSRTGLMSKHILSEISSKVYGVSISYFG